MLSHHVTHLRPTRASISTTASVRTSITENATNGPRKQVKKCSRPVIVHVPSAKYVTAFWSIKNKNKAIRIEGNLTGIYYVVQFQEDDSKSEWQTLERCITSDGTQISRSEFQRGHKYRLRVAIYGQKIWSKYSSPSKWFDSETMWSSDDSSEGGSSSSICSNGVSTIANVKYLNNDLHVKWSHPHWGSYIGEHYCNVPHGAGRWSHSCGDRYEGEFKYGYRHGKGTYQWANGTVYTGEWRYGCKHGAGTWKKENNEEYKGEFQEDLPHGLGSYQWNNGNEYIGNWAEGVIHGRGEFRFHDNRVWRGTFEDGKASKRDPKGRNADIISSSRLHPLSPKRLVSSLRNGSLAHILSAAPNNGISASPKSSKLSRGASLTKLNQRSCSRTFCRQLSKVLESDVAKLREKRVDADTEASVLPQSFQTSKLVEDPDVDNMFDFPTECEQSLPRESSETDRNSTTSSSISSSATPSSGMMVLSDPNSSELMQNRRGNKIQ